MKGIKREQPENLSFEELKKLAPKVKGKKPNQCYGEIELQRRDAIVIIKKRDLCSFFENLRSSLS